MSAAAPSSTLFLPYAGTNLFAERISRSDDDNNTIQYSSRQWGFEVNLDAMRSIADQYIRVRCTSASSGGDASREYWFTVLVPTAGIHKFSLMSAAEKANVHWRLVETTEESPKFILQLLDKKQEVTSV